MSSPVVAGGLVYLGARDGSLYALDALTGDVRWRFRTEGFGEFSTPAVANGTVFVGSESLHLYALDAATGAERWRFFTDAFTSIPAPAAADGLVLVGTGDRVLHALDAATGVERWRYAAEREFWSPPAVAGGVVYASAGDAWVHAIDEATGRRLWRFEAASVVESSPSVAGGLVFFGGSAAKVYALDARTGSERWSFLARARVLSSPAVANGTVFAGAEDGSVYALDAGTGALRWRASTGDDVRSSPAVAGGVVYVGSMDGSVYALDALDGRRLWERRTGGSIMWSSPAVAGGWLYIGSTDGSMYAFRRRSPPGLGWTVALALLAALALAAALRFGPGALARLRAAAQAGGRGRRGPREWLARAALAAAGVALSLALAELAARSLQLAPAVYAIRTSGPEDAFELSENPVLGYEFKKGFRSSGSFSFMTVPSTNSHGQRDVERAWEKGASTSRVVVLGDSVAAGLGIQDLDDTIPRQLERSLGPSGVEVLNLGVPGYSTVGEVELLRTKGVRYSPDLVLVIMNENDQYERANVQISHIGSDASPAATWLFLRSHLFRYVVLRYDPFGLAWRLDPRYRERRHGEAIGGRDLDRTMSELSSLAREHGFVPVIALWPVFPRTADPAEAARRPWNDPDAAGRVERAAARWNVTLVKLADGFKGDLASRANATCPGCRAPSPSKLYTSGDTVHPNELGASVAADLLTPVVGPLLPPR